MFCEHDKSISIFVALLIGIVGQVEFGAGVADVKVNSPTGGGLTMAISQEVDPLVVDSGFCEVGTVPVKLRKY